jgi:hypothetical protein
MSSSLQQWAERWINVVTEGGTTASRIVLTSEGQKWETWERPFTKPEDWAREAEALMSTLCEELPARKIQLMFTAEEAAGGILAQFPKSIIGKNKAAAEIGSQAGAKALSDALAACATTMDAILKSAAQWVTTMAVRTDADSEEIRALHDLLRAKREEEALATEQDSAVKTILVEQLKGLGPLISSGAELWMEKKKSELAKKAPSAVASAVEAVAASAAKKPPIPPVTPANGAVTP